MASDEIKAVDGSQNSTFAAITRSALPANKQALDVAATSPSGGALATEATLAQVRDNLADIEGYVDQLEGFVDGLEALGTAGNALLTSILAATDQLEGYVDGLEGFTDGLEGLLTSANSTLTSILASVDGLEGFTDGIEGLLTTIRDNADQLEGFLDGVETLLTSIRDNEFSDTATLTNVAASTTSVSLLAANSARKGFKLYNDSAQACYVKFGTTASTTSFTVRMAANSFFESITPRYRGVIHGIWIAAVGDMHVTELT